MTDTDSSFVVRRVYSIYTAPHRAADRALLYAETLPGTGTLHSARQDP